MRLCAFIPDISTQPLGMALSRRAWLQLNRFCTGVRCFCSCLHKWSIAPFALVSVAQKNWPLSLLSSTVQSINLPMKCMPDSFKRMTRQWNGCSTPTQIECGQAVNWKNCSNDEEAVDLAMKKFWLPLAYILDNNDIPLMISGTGYCKYWEAACYEFYALSQFQLINIFGF